MYVGNTGETGNPPSTGLWTDVGMVDKLIFSWRESVRWFGSQTRGNHSGIYLDLILPMVALIEIMLNVAKEKNSVQ